MVVVNPTAVGGVRSMTKVLLVEPASPTAPVAPTTTMYVPSPGKVVAERA